MRRRIAVIAGAAGALALVAAGCGGGGKSTSGVQGASHTLATSGAKKDRI